MLGHLLPSTLEAFRHEVREFIAQRLDPATSERLRLGHTPTPEETIAWHRALNEKGWAAPHWPKQYGGAQLTQAERQVLIDELYRAPAPLPLVFNVNLLGPILIKHGTEEQKALFLPKLTQLELWFCQGFSEPEAGSDLASLRTSATREGDEYVVNGHKIWTTTAHVADWIFCLVRTSREERKQQGITFLLIDLKTPGITIRPIISIDGAHHFNEVFFEDVRVPVSQRIGQEGMGWTYAKELLNSERTGIAGVGWCQERLRYATILAQSISRDGAPLIEQPHIRAEIARLQAEVRALEWTNWRFLLQSNTTDAGATASILKLRGSALQQDVATLLQRIVGPDGITRPEALHLSTETRESALTARYLYLRAASIYGGTNEIQRDILAHAILR